MTTTEAGDGKRKAAPLERLVRRTIMSAELRVDCYSGPSFDQHRKYWWASAEGDKDSSDVNDPLRLSAEHFPPGTVVEVQVPICPECGDTAEFCRCGFDWRAWAENQYA